MASQFMGAEFSIYLDFTFTTPIFIGPIITCKNLINCSALLSIYVYHSLPRPYDIYIARADTDNHGYSDVRLRPCSDYYYIIISC